MQIPQCKIDEFYKLIREGSKLRAIKLFRDTTGSSLQQAKAFIEELEADMKTSEPETFHLPPISEDLEMRERVIDRHQLEKVLREVPSDWSVVSFDIWAMGWVATLQSGIREFTLIKDRGYLELQEIVNGQEKIIPVPYQENLSDKRTINLMVQKAEKDHDSV